jgi:hypothetical protein
MNTTPRRQHERRWILGPAVFLCVATIARAEDGPVPSADPQAQGTDLPDSMTEPRQILPDRSQGLAGLVGPFLWGRSADLGAEVRFCDPNGVPDAQGDFLWLYQFKRSGRKNPECIQLHERNNLTSIHPGIAYEFQPSRVILNTPQKTVLKLMVGYVAKDFRFVHGDNADMVHVAGTARVCAFVPIARTAETNPYDQGHYVVDTSHDQPTVGVFELAPGETIASGPIYGAIAKKRILLDLRETLGGKAPNCPIDRKPMFRFTLEGRGKWTLKIKPDGRNGLKGGARENDWDLVFTESSPGARPYTVNLEPAGSTWAMSVFSPGGVEESSELVVGLKPFDRATGQPVPWPKRDERVRTMPVDQIEKALATGSPVSGASGGAKRRAGKP